MVAGEDHDQVTSTPTRSPATFELERFVWAAPDRLEVAGRFSGLDDVPAGPPELVVHGPERAHRLHAPDSAPPPLEDGTAWAAEFVWQEPPVAFEVATLELGADVAVDLPQPGTKRRWIRSQTLAVRTAADPADEVVWEAPSADHAAEPEEEEEEATTVGAADRVGLEAELLAAREEIRDLRAAAERTQEELARARDDLERDRERHTGDAERFRAGLEQVRRSAADAVAAEHAALEDAESALGETRAAIEAKDAELEELRGRLEEEAAARAQAESDAQTAAQAHEEHLTGLGEARRTADEARAGAEQMLTHLQAIRHALGDGE
jgi:hypothetical protein